MTTNHQDHKNVIYSCIVSTEFWMCHLAGQTLLIRWIWIVICTVSYWLNIHLLEYEREHFTQSSWCEKWMADKEVSVQIEWEQGVGGMYSTILPLYSCSNTILLLCRQNIVNSCAPKFNLYSFMLKVAVVELLGPAWNLGFSTSWEVSFCLPGGCTWFHPRY